MGVATSTRGAASVWKEAKCPLGTSVVLPGMGNGDALAWDLLKISIYSFFFSRPSDLPHAMFPPSGLLYRPTACPENTPCSALPT